MKRSKRRRGGLVELFCVRVNGARGRRPECEDPGCSGAEHDLASGEEGRAWGCERETARLVRQGREQYGDLDELEDAGPSAGGDPG